MRCGSRILDRGEAASAGLCELCDGCKEQVDESADPEEEADCDRGRPCAGAGRFRLAPWRGLRVRVKVLPLFGDRHPRRRDHSYGRRDATSPNSDTSWLPGHEGTGQGSTNVGSHPLSGAAPRFSWTPPVPAPSNEPELSFREAVMTLLVVAAFLACIVVAAIQFM
jgi:hypothetical protein